jgi:hypothetical protein
MIPTNIRVEEFYPALVAAFVIVGAIWRFAVPLLGAVKSALVEFTETKLHVESVKKDVADLKPKVDLILQVQTQQLNDGKRIDRIEQDVDRMRAQIGHGNA